jgi:ATP-dependent RNA helicase DDX10/DBP4
MPKHKNKSSPRKHGQNRKPRASQIEAQEIEHLERAIREGQPPAGSTPLLHSIPEGASYLGVTKFSQLPISGYTERALQKHGYTHLTAIQRASLPHSLCGRDILGAAKTGSGKTLCFVIPVGILTSCVAAPATALLLLCLLSCFVQNK